MSSSRRLLVALTALGLLAGFSLLPDALAQQPRPVPVDPAGNSAEEQTFDGLSIPKDREATAIINAAREYVIKKDWDTVARSLQFLLERPEDSFFEVTRKDENGKEYTARISIRIEANRLIGELPPEGLETYRQKYGQRAMILLQEGKDKNDPAILSQVALKYRHTEAGVEAIRLLGNYFLDRGNYQLASGKFQELLELLEKEKPEVRQQVGAITFFKAALAYQRFGDTAMADRLWKQVVEMAGEKGVMIGKTTYSLEQLKKELDRDASVGSRTLSGVQVVRGDASRTAQGIGGTPFLDPRWSVSMFVPDRTKERLAREEADPTAQSWIKTSEWVQDKIRTATEMMEKSSASKRPALPGFYPVAAGNKVIVRTYDGVYAFYLRDDPTLGVKAGELAWAQPTEGSLHAMGSEHKGHRGTTESWWGQYYGTMGQNYSMPSVLFENSTVGTLSHDNNLVYYVDDLAMPPHPATTMHGFNGQAAPFGAFTDMVLHNTLRAVELDTGRLKWEVGGRKQNGKVPVIMQPGMIRRIVRPDGKIVQIGPDGQEVEIDPKTGQPIKKPEEAAKPFVPPKDLPETKGFVNAADELRDTFFLGPPLPIGGKIYVLVEVNGEVQLCCIDPKREEKCKEINGTGPELVWRQPLGTANYKLMQDSLRRMQPCHLAYNDGILVCPTNAGAIIAVNLLTQSLAWAYSYRTTNPLNDPDSLQPGLRMRGGRFNNMGALLNIATERWHSAPPAITNGVVVFTAPDSNSIVCLSLRDGKRLWSVNRQQGDLYMAGVYDGRVLIVGKDSVRALKLSDGTPAWDRPKAIGMPSGQGVASKGKYYLPCRTGVDSPDPQIVEIDIATGKTHATKSRRKEIPGNLIFFDGEVVSQSATSISAYPQLHVKLAEMDARLTKNPNDPQGLTDRGELHLDKGELIKAVDDLKTALSFNPDPDTRAKARLKLYESLTELLQTNFNVGEQHLDLYRDLCTKEVDAEEKQKRYSAYLCLLGKGRESQGKLVEAFQAYMEFGQLNNAKEMVPSVDEPGTMARPDVWASGRIHNMIAKATPEQRKPLEERVASEWAVVKKSDDLDKIKDFVKVFGSMFSAGMEARLVLAEKLMVSTNSADQLQAELYLNMLREQRDDLAVAAQATETMARLMVKKGMLRDAVVLYRRLGTIFKDQKLPDGRTGADVYNELMTDKRFLPYLEATSALWGPGKMKGEVVNGPFNTMMQSSFTLELEGELLPFFQQHRLMIDTQSPSGNNMWQLRLVDRATGETKWKHGNLLPNSYIQQQNFGNAMTLAGSQPRFAQVRGHLLMLSMQHMVYVFDLAERKKLMEINLLGKNSRPQLTDTRTDADGTVRLMYADGTRVRIGQVGILESNYVCLPTRNGLVAMDPVTGATLWTRESGSGAHIFGDREYIFVVESGEDGSPARTMVVRAADGVSVKAPDFSQHFHPTRRLATQGRHLLVFDDSRGGKALRLLDPLTGKDVWRHEVPEGTKPVRSQEPGLAGTIRPDGTLTILDTYTGQALLETKHEDDRVLTEHLSGLQEVVLMQDRNFYYIALNKPHEANVQAYPFVTNGLRSLRVHGTLYAYNKAESRLEWYRDDIANQYLILEHLDELPILIFGAMVNRFNQPQQARVEAVDKTTGKLMFDRGVTNNGQFYAMHADARNGVIELLRYDLKIRFTQEGSPGEKDPSKGAGERVRVGAVNGVDVAPIPQPIGPGQIRIMPAQRIQVQIAPAVVPVAPPPPPPPPKKVEKPAEKPKN